MGDILSEIYSFDSFFYDFLILVLFWDFFGVICGFWNYSEFFLQLQYVTWEYFYWNLFIWDLLIWFLDFLHLGLIFGF